ncbi:Nucleic acid-binding protein [Corchorus capsularis]|uniref:Nucleic acid-binding protein n=1 Tax=Corchorus capsularis TaxID=210143 RepID=A0A1R3IZ91_COCAP|nr:Nucleic acid-binding protein [Corchorus capsularis]
MVLTNLSQLHPPAANDAIKLRIARAWDITVPGSEKIVGLAFVATDNQGNAIHVQTNESDAEIFRDLVFEGALYLIAAFRLTRANVSHVAVQSDLIMWLTRRSVLRPIPDDYHLTQDTILSFMLKKISPKWQTTMVFWQLTITLWDRSLDMINVPQLLSMNPKPVMIFAGMLVRIINGRPALTSSFATKLYVNLDIDETAMVQAM